MNQALHDLCLAIYEVVLDRAKALRYRDGDASVFDGYGLEPAARDALAAHDLAGLYRLGVHPLLVFHLSAIVFGRAHYVKHVVPAIQGVVNPFYDYYRLRAGKSA